MMAMNFEEQYYDVLRGIELAIQAIYSQHDDLTDHSVTKALDAVHRTYKAQMRQRRTPTLKLGTVERQLYQAIYQVCELHLGRDPQVKLETKRTIDEILACVQRIQRSVGQMDGRGRQAYVQFLDNFLKSYHDNMGE